MKDARILEGSSSNDVVVFPQEDTGQYLPDSISPQLSETGVNRETLETMIGNMVEGNNDTITTDYNDETGKITISTTLRHDQLSDEDQDTSIMMEQYDDEDQIRLYINGTEEARFDSEGNFDLMGDKIEDANISGGTF